MNFLFKRNYFSKKNWVLFLLFFGVHLNTYSQENLRTTVVQPSPTSSKFNRYGVDQPSLSTGTVNIPISLFNIEAKGLNIPITLTYQTSGITAFDTPYPAGYGWVLSPAFRITRVILGRKDEDFLFNSNPDMDYEIIKRGIIDEQTASYHQYSNSDLFDTQKDIFTLHMPQGSFNFFIKKVGSTLEAVSISNQIRIKPITGISGTPLMGFEVTDANGIIYSFGYSDPANSLDYTEPAPFSASTAWMLREITLLNKEKITFSWQKVNTNTYSAKVSTPVSIKDRRDVDPYHDDYVTDLGGMIDCSTFSGANSLMLKEIELSNESIEFTYKSSQDPFLQSILVKNKSNIAIKTINFEYGTNSTNGSNRLLNSLKINGEEYKFIYNTKYFGETTTALDYWGYYNGKTSNLSLIPQMTLKIFTGIRPIPYDWWTPSPITIGNADRSVSAEDMQAYMLTKIIYPTGGFSTYEYEPHQFTGIPQSHSTELFLQNPPLLTSGGGLRVKKIENYPNSESTPEIRIFKYGDNENGLANIEIAPTLETFIEEFGHAREESIDVAPGGVQWWSFRQMNINSISNYSKYLLSKNPIWYSKVTEYINNDQKTAYSFSFNDAYDVSWELNFYAVFSPFVFRYGNLFNNGPKLINTIIYKKNGLNYFPVKNILNDYETIHNLSEDISSMIIDRNGIFDHLSLPGIDLYPPSPSFYPSGSYPSATIEFPGALDFKKYPYSISVEYDRLKNSTTSITDDNSSTMNLSENYYYNGLGQISKISKNTSVTGKEISVEYKYPIDFTDAPYPLMITKNIVSPVIEETISNNSNTVKKTKKNYSNFLMNDLILPSSVQIQNGSNVMETRANFNKYDSFGNILEQQKSNDLKQSYIWGYNNSYCIADVVNASSNEIFFEPFEESIGWDGTIGRNFGGSPLSAFDKTMSHTGKASGRIDKLTPGERYCHSSQTLNISLTAPKKFKVSGWVYSNGPSVDIYLFMKRQNESNYFSYVDYLTTSTINQWVYVEKEFTVPADVVNLNIRLDNNGGGNVWFDDIRLYPSNAQMTTYTYDPLIGMTSQSDANNRITYYQYDTFGRLSLVRDQDNNIIKKICYNYAGQAGDCSVSTAPNWIATGNLRCQTNGSGNTGYQEREEVDQNPNSTTFNQTRWIQDVYNTTACPLPPPPCTITMNSGFNNTTNSILNNGTSVSFYMVFSSNSIMSPGGTYYVANITGSCRPSATRTIDYSSSGRNWTITIYPSGAMYWYLNPGSTSVPAYYTFGTSTLTYNL